MPRTTPEGLESLPLQTGHDVSHRKLQPFPVPLLLMGGAASEGTPRPRTSVRGGELGTHQLTRL